MAAVQWPDESIFEPFTIFEETYKNVSEHALKAAVFIPKTLEKGRYPVIVNVHGGFFMTGHSLFAPFFSLSTLTLALRHSAIIVSPDYRLLPTDKGIADILDDLDDFWRWSRSDLPQILDRRAPGLQLDFSRLLLTGGSAGGYCAAQLALSYPDDISAVGMIYPALELEDGHWYNGPAPGEPTILRFDEKDIPDRHATQAWVEEKKKTLTSKDGLARSAFSVGTATHGMFMTKVVDPLDTKDPRIFPLQRLAAGARLPKSIWLMHGDDDSCCPLRGSQKFVDAVQRKFPDTAVRFDIIPGQDHAFDVDDSTWASVSPAALKFVADAWLSL